MRSKSSRVRAWITTTAMYRGPATTPHANSARVVVVVVSVGEPDLTAPTVVII
jgi:hypothetical protein